MRLLIQLFYLAVSVGMAACGLNSLYLPWLYRRNCGAQGAPPNLTVWPHGNVRLLAYNELHTVERLLAAVDSLDYPRVVSSQ